MEGILLLALLTFGGLGLFMAMPAGRAHAGRAGLLLLIIAAAMVTLLMLQWAGEGGHPVAVALLALISLGAATRVITHAKPVYSALYFILVIVATCGLLLLAQAEFLAAATMIIYGGAILVTYVFVIMLAQQSGGPPEYDRTAREPFIGVLAGMLILAILCGRVLGAKPGPTPLIARIELPGTVSNTGTVLLTEYAVGVQIAAILLLAALVGAVAIARRRATLDEEDA
jgi:NADH-quinone oxidoreductase subunit J